MRYPKWFQLLITWFFIISLTIISIELINLVAKSYDHRNYSPIENVPPQKVTPTPLHWGVDTANTIDTAAYQCITQHFGKPVFVGRYLGNKDKVSVGLTKKEANFLHQKQIKILPIHNQLKTATGLKTGQSEAKQAIQLAKAVGIKDNVLLVVDIEPNFSVDHNFLIGWTETLVKNNFIPGVYGDFGNKQLENAYMTATQKDKAVRNRLVLWTNQPDSNVTGPKKAPHRFEGKSPVAANTLNWQYGINNEQCKIDTDVAKETLLDMLW